MIAIVCRACGSDEIRASKHHELECLNCYNEFDISDAGIKVMNIPELKEVILRDHDHETLTAKVTKYIDIFYNEDEKNIINANIKEIESKGLSVCVII